MKRHLLIRFWAYRIHKSMGLTKPYQLHIVEHNDPVNFSANQLELHRDKTMKPETLGNFTIPKVYSKYHHIFLRVRPLHKETLYVLAHELQHAKQCESYKMPWEFESAYIEETNEHGYLRNRFEAECREVGCDWVNRILHTGPLELFDGMGSLLVKKGNSIGLADDKPKQPEIDWGMTWPKDKVTTAPFPGYSLPNEFTLNYTFEWSDKAAYKLYDNPQDTFRSQYATLFGKDSLSKIKLLTEAKGFDSNLPQPSEEGSSCFMLTCDDGQPR